MKKSPLPGFPYSDQLRIPEVGFDPLESWGILAASCGEQATVACLCVCAWGRAGCSRWPSLDSRSSTVSKFSVSVEDAALTAAADARFGAFSRMGGCLPSVSPLGEDTLQKPASRGQCFKDGLFNSHTDPTVLSAPRPAHPTTWGCTLLDVLLFKIFELLPYRAPPYGR